MATNYKNDNFYQITDDKQTVPLSVDVTGTISTTGLYITGVGTKFMTNSELKRGFWVTDLTNNEIRKVDSVLDDTTATLENAFTTDIVAGTTPNVIFATSLNIKKLSVAINPVLTNGAVDGTPLVAGSTLSFGKESKDNTNAFSYIDPIIADATGTVMDVTILR